MSLNKDIQSTLIAEWLSGEHKGDMQIFDAAEFTEYEGLFASMKEDPEANIIGLAKRSGMEIQTIAEITHSLRYLDYDTCFTEMKNQHMARQLQNVKVENIRDTLKQVEQELLIGKAEDDTDWIIDYIMGLNDRKKQKRMYYGFENIDRLTGGIRAGELTTISARPGVGKSAFTLQVAMNVVNDGLKVLYLPLEMTKNEIAERLFCKNTTVPNERLKTGNLKAEDYEKLSVYGESLNKLKDKFIMLTQTRSIPDIEKATARYEPDLIVVDQLSLLRGAPSEKIREQFSYYTKELKYLAAKANIAVMLVAQLRRSAEQQEPTLSDLKESGSIEEDSDNVLMIHQLSIDDASGIDKFNGIDFKAVRPCSFIVGKQRNGQVGKVYSTFKGDKFTFTEL